MTRFHPFPFILLLFTLLALPAAAQKQNGGLKGVIADSSSGERLTLVNVLVIGQGIGAATDANGFYFVGNIPAGPHRVRATLIGYRTVEKEVVIKAGAIVSLNMLLAPTAVEMETVEATAERRTRYDTEISTQPIGQAEISIVPKTIEADLFRAVSILPGVVTTSDMSSQFYVRGGSGDQNLIILDGMTIYNPFHALGIFSIFDADAVKEAEILKGGFPAQWGTRLSSVMNIKTREGNQNRFAGKASISQVSGKALLEGPTPWDGSWMVAARKSFFDEVLQKFVRQDTPFDFYDVMARMNVNTGESGRLSVHMLLTGDAVASEDTYEPEYRWSNKAYGLSWFEVLENKFLIETSFSFSNFRGDLDPRMNAQITPRVSEVNDVYFNGGVTYFRDNGDMYGAGFMFRLPQYHYSFVNSANVSRDVYAKNSETGIWFRYKLKQLYPFTAEFGLRSDLFSVLSTSPGDAFEPRMTLNYEFSNLLAAKLAYARVHQRIITITNEDDVVALFTTWVPIPDDQPAEQADHYIAGLDGAIPIVQGLSYNLQGYYKSFSNLVEYNLDKVDAADPDFVRGTGNSYGAEVLLEQRSPHYYGWLSYTWGWTERTANGVTYAPRYDRRHSFDVVAGWRPGDGWDFNVRFEYGSGLPFTQITGYYDRILFSGLFESKGYATEPGSPYTMLGQKNSGRLPDYLRLDIGAGKSWRLDPVRLTLEANIINVTNRDNMFYYDQTTGERVDMLPILPTISLSVEF